LRPEDITDQAVSLVQIDALSGHGSDAGGVLTTVLQHRESVIKCRGNIRGTDDSEYSAHKKPF
jgi:hypothetical protein